jgi:hypothetical protein
LPKVAFAPESATNRADSGAMPTSNTAQLMAAAARTGFYWGARAWVGMGLQQMLGNARALLG